MARKKTLPIRRRADPAGMRILTPHPVHEGVGNALREAFAPPPPGDMTAELDRLLERLH